MRASTNRDVRCDEDAPGAGSAAPCNADTAAVRDAVARADVPMAMGHRVPAAGAVTCHPPPAATAGEACASGGDAADTLTLPGSAFTKAVVALVGLAGLAWGYQFGAQLSGPWLGVVTALGTGLFGVLLADSAVDALARAADRRGSTPR